MDRSVAEKQFKALAASNVEGLVRTLVMAGRSTSYMSDEQLEREVIVPAIRMVEESRPSILKKIAKIADRLADWVG